MNWINVKEYLPEEYRVVLYYSSCEAWFIGSLYSGQWHYLSTQEPIDRHFNITHWMPLPRPPEED